MGLLRGLPNIGSRKSGKDLPKAPTNDKQSAINDNLSLDDVLAPGNLEVDFSNIEINDRFYRSFFVSNYPRYVEANWLEPLIDFEHTLTISMFIYP